MRNVGRLMTVMLTLLLLCSTGGSFAQDGDGSLTVEVTNTSGQPLKDACVTFVPKSGDIVFRKGDGRGRVRVKKLPAGSYRVVVKVDGYEAQKREVAVTGQTETVAFLLEPRKN